MDVTDVTGRFGPWQRRTLCVLLYRAIPMSFIFLATQFNAPVDHWCARDDPLNITVQEWRSCCVPSDNKCEKYLFDADGVNSNRTVKCDDWEFGDTVDEGELNIRKEYSLVCHRTWLIALIYTVFKLGNFLTYIPSGYLADRYGRRITCLTGMVSLVIIGGIGAFSPNIEFFLVTRFLGGIAYSLFQTTSLCLFVESVGPEYRLLMSLSFLGSWGMGMMILAGLALATSNWRTLQLITYVPFCALTPILIWKFVPETPRWLLTAGKYDEAEKVILEAAKMNGIKIQDKDATMKKLIEKIEQDKEKDNTKQKATILDLFRKRTLRKMTIILWLTMALMSFVGSGFMYSTDQLGGSLHMNIFIMGLLDVVSTGIFLIEAKYISRRRGLLLNLFLAGIFFLIALPIPENLLTLRIALALLGKTCNSIAYTILWLFAAEIFPTNLRVIGISGSMTSGRVGSLIGTYAGELGRLAGKDVPMIVFGVVSMVTSFLYLLLPETRDKHLPDTVKESERLPDVLEIKQ